MSSEEEDNKNKSADAILEMLKEAGVSAKNIEDVAKKHAFWDTQVGLTLARFHHCILLNPYY